MRALVVRTVIFSLGAVAAITSADGRAESDYRHSDYRSGQKIVTEIDFPNQGAQLDRDFALSYLESHRDLFGIRNLNELQFRKVKHSLLGRHIYFQQLKGGVPVDGGEIIVTVSHSGSLTRIFNNFYPSTVDFEVVPSSLIGDDVALDVAWNDLGVRGELFAMPKAELQYRVAENGVFSLGYKTLTEVAQPVGAWEHFIDAKSGAILSRRDTRVTRMKKLRGQEPVFLKGKTWNRLDAIDTLARKERAARQSSLSNGTPSAGSGVVFDPDPRTALKTIDIGDASPPASFDGAYFVREFPEVTQVKGTFHLMGPWVTIADFERPYLPPATSTDGQWTAKRGDDGFNDAMTYFHIDQSQRYMQSLGFVGERGIQFGSIEVDANGLSGQDNSHYIPSSNRMAFGHGCIDDNEDADVILHEYGHAINFSINENWGGGDSGAIGEGFGDYWAGSYSLSTDNGLEFERDKVFNWDGAACWEGRTLNADGAIYDPGETYEAHASIAGGFISDELWSTPIFQSLVTLTAEGIARREVDQIILEAQFGLGYGIKMRDMAYSILRAASSLYPGGPHEAAFRAAFERHQII